MNLTGQPVLNESEEALMAAQADYVRALIAEQTATKMDKVASPDMESAMNTISVLQGLTDQQKTQFTPIHWRANGRLYASGYNASVVPVLYVPLVYSGSDARGKRVDDGVVVSEHAFQQFAFLPEDEKEFLQGIRSEVSPKEYQKYLKDNHARLREYFSALHKMEQKLQVFIFEHDAAGGKKVVGFTDDADIGGEFEDPQLAAASRAFKELAAKPKPESGGSKERVKTDIMAALNLLTSEVTTLKVAMAKDPGWTAIRDELSRLVGVIIEMQAEASKKFRPDDASALLGGLADVKFAIQHVGDRVAHLESLAAAGTNVLPSLPSVSTAAVAGIVKAASKPKGKKERKRAKERKGKEPVVETREATLESVLGNEGHKLFTEGHVFFVNRVDNSVVGHGLLINQHLFAPSHVLRDAYDSKCDFVSVSASRSAVSATIPTDRSFDDLLGKIKDEDWSYFKFVVANGSNIKSASFAIPDAKEEVCLQKHIFLERMVDGIRVPQCATTCVTSHTESKTATVPGVGDCMRHYCDTQPGDCGCPVVQKTKIVGLHVAGSVSGNFFMPVTKRFLDFVSRASF